MAERSSVAVCYQAVESQVGGKERQGERCTKLRKRTWKCILETFSQVSAAIAVSLGGLGKPLETVSE